MSLQSDHRLSVRVMLSRPLVAGLRVVRVLKRLLEATGLPEPIVVDNGPEFSGRTLDSWAYAHSVPLRFIENAFVESSTARFATNA